ncbi:hypothetical protein JCM9279_006794 [Rhodotorula babjevae]
MTTPHQEAAPEGDLTLGQLLTRALRSADRILQAPSPNDPKIQSDLAKTLADLDLSRKLIDHLGVLSPNDRLDDLSTRNLRCLVVPALQAQLALAVRTRGGQERLEWLHRARAHWLAFLDLVDRYGVLGAGGDNDAADERRKALQGPRIGDTDPARRRAGKIAQFKMEREIKGTLDELRARRRTRRVRGSAAPTTSTSSSSTSTAAAAAADVEDDYPSSSDDEDDATASVARPLLVNLLTLHTLRAHADLDSIAHESDLLEHGLKLSEIPSPGPHAAVADGRASRREGDDEGDADRWRLDSLGDKAGGGPMLSPGGKVLRPFTILPSSSNGGSSSSGQLSTRLRLQSEVFRESWRLPTMTIDEYLAQEEQAGRVLQGGGERTTDEVDQARRDERADDEEEDTREGYERVERGLRKAREWDDYRDEHRKGEGNMHNRG